jgi:ribA/ribD-fused uncharacterized protein
MNIYASETDARQGLSLLQMNTVRSAPAPTFELFWGGFMSQWAPTPLTVDGLVYVTAEHFMMVSKARLFHDHETVANILATPSPKEAKALGRQVKGFDEHIWAERRYDVVRATCSSSHRTDHRSKLSEKRVTRSSSKQVRTTTSGASVVVRRTLLLVTFFSGVV